MARYLRGWSEGWRKAVGQNRQWYDSSWELQYMDELDRDALVERWTRHHGLRIPYRKWWGGRGYYEPDFLVELAGGMKELREVKGEHLFADQNTALKLKAGERFCRARGMKLRVVTKSAVDPAIWQPEQQQVQLKESTMARPALAEDAFIQTQPSNHRLRIAVIIVVASMLLLLLMLLCIL